MGEQQEPPQAQARSRSAAKNLRDPRYALHRFWIGLQRSASVSGDEQYNERLLYIDMIFQALMSAGPLAFVSVYLVRLNAPTWLVGIESSLPALLTLVAVLPAGAFVQRQRDLVRLTTRTRMMYRSIIALIALTGFLPAGVAVYFVVALESLAALPGSVLNVSFTTVLGQTTSPRRRPTMLSTRWAVHGIFAAGLGFAAGQWLDSQAFPFNYQALLATGLVAGIGSWLVLGRLRIPKQEPSPEDEMGAAAPVHGHQAISLHKMAALVASTVSFRNFIIAQFIMRIGTFLPMALFSIYKVRDLGSSDAWLGTLLTVERLLSVLAYTLLSRYGAKPKVRRYLWIGCIGVALFPAAMALATTPVMLLVSTCIAGLFFPAMNIFLSDTLYAVSPEEHRPTFIASNSFVMNTTAFVGPMLGTWLSGIIGIRLALVVATVIRLVGAISLWALGVTGREPKSQRPEAV